MKRVRTINDYHAALLSGTPVEVEGLSGRLIRGNKPEDFLTLTNDKDRFVVLLIDSKTLSRLSGLTGYAMLKTVGYTDTDIATEVVTNGNHFKLVLFPEGGDAVDATWDNMLDLVARQYPRVASLINQHRAELKKSPSQVPFSWYENQRGYKWADVRKAGKSDPRFMTEEKLLVSKGTVVDLREFLYHVIHLRELFQGDGWLLNDKTGRKEDREIAVLNRPLAELGEHELIDISVHVPTRKAPGLMTITPTVADHAPLVYEPEFWDPRKAYQDYEPDLTAALQEGFRYAQTHGLETGQQLRERPEGVSAVYFTDPQCDFRPGGRLPVMGATGGYNSADDVILRSCVRALNGFVTGHYGGWFDSEDGHPSVHCSFASYFKSIKQQGMFDLSQHKAATLKLEDPQRCLFNATCFGLDGSPIPMGLVQPMYNAKDLVACYNHMAATEQLPMWAFTEHCVGGTKGVSLHPLVQEVRAFVTGLRRIVPKPIHKGHIIDRDWFGGLCDVWSYTEGQPGASPNTNHPQAGFQKELVDGWKRFRTIEFVCQIAQDFCGYWTQRQSLWYFEGTEFADKMRYMMDGNAPIIPNAPHVLALYAKAKGLGVKFINHDTPF